MLDRDTTGSFRGWRAPPAAPRAFFSSPECHLMTGRWQEAPDHRRTASRCRLNADFIPDSCVESPYVSQMFLTFDLGLPASIFSPLRPSKPSRQTEMDPVVWGRCLVCLPAPMFAMFWSLINRPATVYILASRWYRSERQCAVALFSHHPVVIVSQTRLSLSLLLRWTGRSEASQVSLWLTDHESTTEVSPTQKILFLWTNFTIKGLNKRCRLPASPCVLFKRSSLSCAKILFQTVGAHQSSWAPTVIVCISSFPELKHVGSMTKSKTVLILRYSLYKDPTT